jgi:succinyl-CoA synthetase alpha subunit
MITEFVIRKNEYHDSSFLMRVAKRISGQRGILQVAALMGTEKNKALLEKIGFQGAAVAAATPNDLILAIRADNGDNLAAVLENMDQWLHPESEASETSSVRTLDEAFARQPNSNLAVISVPGEYAHREAMKALERGLNVFLFRDNVPIEPERSLKEYARERGLIVMGPDCGTALIRGVGVGFANAVRRGPIGVIGASGTGLQEFTTLVHHAGAGISHAIGIGSRDLSDAIGGISLFSAMDALAADSETQVVAILSKPPGPQTLAKLLLQLARYSKPVVGLFLGLKRLPGENIPFRIARTLDDAAAVAVHLATGRLPARAAGIPFDMETHLHQEQEGKTKDQRYVRGLFAGGTFSYQAQQIFQDAGIFVYSNNPIEGNRALSDPFRSVEHTVVDMGADEFTAGRPHPMIDSRFRCERIMAEAQDPQVAILLLDVILGYNAAPDPAGDLAPSIIKARRHSEERGAHLTVIVSVCGTEEDPQHLTQQVERLKEAGATVFLSASEAALFAAKLTARVGETSHG